MPYELLTSRTLYRKIETVTEDSAWVDGVYYPTTSTTVTYEEFLGDFEPVGSGERKTVTPAGFNSEESIWVFSQVELNTTRNLNDNIVEGDVIYLQDPTTVPDTPAYIVFNKETWLTNDGFELLDTDTYDYVGIRLELR